MTKQAIPDLLRVAPGTRPKLGKIDPASTPGFRGDEAAAEERLKELLDELAEFQERLWAEAGQSLLVVLQALDAGGKDGLIRKVISAFNPQGTRVTGFGVPIGGGAAPRLPLARPRGHAGQGAHRRLQPVALRGRPGRARQRARPEVRLEAPI